MTTISEILQMKENNLRCYYIDSDGDEIIISDEEDYDVAIDYAQNKGDGMVKFGLCKRQHNDSEGGSQLNSELGDSIISGVKPFKNIAESTYVENIDDEVDQIKSSEISDDGVEELKEIEKESTAEQELDRILNSRLKETVSEEGSMTITSEITEETNSILEEFNNIREVQSSEVDTDSQNIPLEKRESGVSDVAESISEDFDIIQSRVHSYAPKINEKVELDMEPIQEKVEVSQNSSEKLQKSIEKPSEPSAELKEPEAKVSIVEEQEEELLQLNEEAPKEEISEEQFIELKPESEIKDIQPDEKVNNDPAQVDLDQDWEKAIEEEKVLEDQKEFKDEPRLGVSVSVAQARVIPVENKKRINYFKKALESVKFAFSDPTKKLEIADIDECEEEKNQEYVITATPGQLVKKRWRLINRSNICWPKSTTVKCETEGADVELPKIEKPLRPGQKLDISVNIRINPEETENNVKVFIFRLHSRIYGYFGVALLATVEIIPKEDNKEIEEMSQEDKLTELLEGDDEVNPIMYEIANDFVEEGLGNFDECLNALIECKSNYEEAKEKLLKSE